MKHFAAVDANDQIVSVMSVDDETPNPFTPAMLLDFDPVGVRSLEIPTRAVPRQDKLDANDNVIPDPDTVTADGVAVDVNFFNEEKLKAAFLAMMDVVNVRLLSAGLPEITGAELLAAYKARRGHQ